MHHVSSLPDFFGGGRLMARLVLFVCVVTIALLVVDVFRGEQPLMNYFALRHSAEILQDTNKKLLTEITDLRDEIRKIRGSRDYAQKVLRDKYHLLEANEKIVFFAD